MIIKNKKKILFFTSFPPPNTGQTIASKLIYKSLESDFKLSKINTVDPNRLNRNSGGFSLKFLVLLIKRITALLYTINTTKHEIVYTVYSSTKIGLLKDVLTVFIVKYLCVYKVQITAHLHCGNYGQNFKNKISKKLFSFLLRNTDRLVFLSPMLNHISEFYPLDKTYYLTNMISEDIICTEDEIVKKINNKEKGKSTFDIVFISNMIKEKGYQDLAEALKILKIKNIEKEVKVHYIGGWSDEESKSNFEAKLKSIDGAMQSIVYGPIYDRERIKQFFLNADVFVLPTYYPIEAQPLSIIEALNAATPIISTFHASIPDMISDKQNGFLVNLKSPKEIANAIEKLLDEKLWLEMAKCARHTYINTYSPKVIYPHLFQVFKN